MRRFVLVFALVGCRNVLGISSETEVETHLLGGQAIGVEGASSDPVTVTLSIDGAPAQTLSLASDAPFTFAPVFNESEFTVTTSAGCAVLAGGSGFITGADQLDAITIECDGAFGLADFGFSAPMETVPRLSGAVLNYQTLGSFLTRKTQFEPKPIVASTVAMGYFGATLTIPGTTFNTSTGNAARVELSRGPGPVMRTYSTVLDLSGPASQFGYGKRETSSTGDRFGSAIATSPTILVVGTPVRNEAIVFTRFGRTWIQRAKHTGPSGSELGAAVAIYNNSVYLGAPGEAAVYELRTDDNGGTFTQVNRVAKTAGSRFGAALVGTNPHLFVGAPLSSGRGQVFVYNRAGLVELVGDSPILAPSGAERFGEALASSSSMLVVGSPGDDHGGAAIDAGKVYRYRLTPTPQADGQLTAPTAGAGDQFGAAVAIDALQPPTIAVGAPFEDSATLDTTDNSKPTSGVVYVYRQSPIFFTESLKAPVPDTGDAFGWSLSIDGTLLAVGAPFEDSAAVGIAGSMTDEAAPDAGAVFVYDLAKLDGSAVTLPPQYFKASNTRAGDQFGLCVALTQDALIVGAPAEDSPSTGWNSFQNGGDPDDDRGAVYTFR